MLLKVAKLAGFQTHIVRVINDEDDAEDSNSFMDFQADGNDFKRS